MKKASKKVKKKVKIEYVSVDSFNRFMQSVNNESVAHYLELQKVKEQLERELGILKNNIAFLKKCQAPTFLDFSDRLKWLLFGGDWLLTFKENIKNLFKKD